MSLTQPDPILQPFAATATGPYINVIPNADPGGGLASYELGFPPVTFLPVPSGGTPPYGADFNGILNALSANDQWSQAGMPFTFVASLSTALSGYSAGALIAKSDYSLVWMSKAGSNTHNPGTLANVGTYWFPAIGEGTVGLARLAAVSGSANAIVLTSAINPVPFGGGTAIEQVVYFVASANNTAAVTINVDGAGALALHNNAGAALAANDIVSGQLYQVLYNGTDWQLVGYVPSQAAGNSYAYAEAVDASPTGTTSGTAKMQGIGLLGASITPTTSGKVLAIVSGTGGNATTSDGGIINMRYGTGTAPSNGDATTGTLLSGTNRELDFPGASEVASFAAQRVITGLTLGTAYWFDLDSAAVGGGTFDLTHVTLTLTELP